MLTINGGDRLCEQLDDRERRQQLQLRAAASYNSGTLNVTNSTVSGNSGLLRRRHLNYGTLTLTNSTVSGNTADYYGGGIFNAAR